MLLRDLYAGPPAHDPLGINDRWEFAASAGQHRWRRFAPNNVQVGASTEAYWNLDDCVWNARRHGYVKNPPTAADILARQLSDGPDPFGKNDNWGFYQDPFGHWRWWRNARNNKRVGASTEGYRSHPDCVANAVRNGYVAP